MLGVESVAADDDALTASMRLVLAREHLDTACFTVERLQSQLASPMDLLTAIPLAVVQLVHGYAQLTQAQQLRLHATLQPLLVRAVRTVAGFEVEVPHCQPSLLADTQLSTSLTCHSCQLLLRQPVRLPCCGAVMCGLWWMALHLSRGELLQRAVGPVTVMLDCPAPPCTKTVHVGEVHVDQAMQSRVNSATVRCSLSGCTDTFPLSVAQQHPDVCSSALVRCEQCGARVQRRGIADHAQLCPSPMTEDTEHGDQHMDGEDSQEQSEDEAETEEDGEDREEEGQSEGEGEGEEVEEEELEEDGGAAEGGDGGLQFPD